MSIYKLHVPAEEGYTDVTGRFYECTCGANFIDIEQSEEWIYCPFCGEKIAEKETLMCAECESADPQDEGLYCINPLGKFRHDNVAESSFEGCKEWRWRDDEP